LIECSFREIKGGKGCFYAWKAKKKRKNEKIEKNTLDVFVGISIIGVVPVEND
jgi:hypothetical protein